MKQYQKHSKYAYTYYQNTHTLENKLKQPQYKLKQMQCKLKQMQCKLKQPQCKLKQTQCKRYPNEIVTVASSTLSIRSR